MIIKKLFFAFSLLILMVSYQNCSNSEVGFSDMNSELGVTKIASASIVAPKQANVGQYISIFTTSDTNQVLSSTWSIFENGNLIDQDPMISSGEEVITYAFRVKGQYRIRAEIHIQGFAEPLIRWQDIEITDRIYACKPAVGVSVVSEQIYVGEMASFATNTFDCLGHTGEVDWYFSKVEDKGGPQEPLSEIHVNGGGDLEIALPITGTWIVRVELKRYDGKEESYTSNAFEVLEKSTNYKWSCDLSCGVSTSIPNNLISKHDGQSYFCRDSSDENVDVSNCLGQDYPSCLAVCDNDPYETDM